MTILNYIGNGKHITGIPAQDLTDADISRIAGEYGMPENELIDLLILRGLYSHPPQVETPPPQTWQHTPVDVTIQPETWQWTSDIEGVLPETDENEEGE